MKMRYMYEKIAYLIMILSFILVLSCLLLLIGEIFYRGASSLSLAMITETETSAYYSGSGGGILNAIIGSLYLAGGASIISLLVSIPLALSLQQTHKGVRIKELTRFVLTVFCGIPTIIVGAVIFLVMIQIGARAGLIWGIITLSLFITPLMTKGMDEAMQAVPVSLLHSSYLLGATEQETLINVVFRQSIPGIVAAFLLSFGRAIGDAASLLFTAGYSSQIPVTIFDSVASLPLSIFYQLSSPFPAVQQKAYAASIILLGIVIGVSIISRLIAQKISRYVIR